MEQGLSRGSRSLLAHPKLSHSPNALISTANGTLHHHILAKVTGSVDKLSSQTWCLLLETICSWCFCAQMAFHAPVAENGTDNSPGQSPWLGETREHDPDGKKLSVDGNNISGAGTKLLHEKSSMDHCSKKQAPWLAGLTGPLTVHGSQTLQGRSLAPRCRSFLLSSAFSLEAHPSLACHGDGWHSLSTAGMALSPGSEVPV